ncbi:MAG: hypothetical protein MZW92_80920 [Comamonadaceae bacterium]|nr:hypothetical protein [Comamonadaceae bacterium]
MENRTRTDEPPMLVRMICRIVVCAGNTTGVDVDGTCCGLVAQVPTQFASGSGLQRSQCTLGSRPAKAALTASAPSQRRRVTPVAGSSICCLLCGG